MDVLLIIVIVALVVVSLVNARTSQKIREAATFDGLLSALLTLGLSVICIPFSLGLTNSAALLIGVWIITVIAYIIRQGFSLRTVLLANGCALSFVLAYDLVFYSFFIIQNFLGDTSSVRILTEATDTRDFLIVGVCALACLFITALGKMLRGTFAASVRSEHILWPLSIFLVFSLVNELLDIGSLPLLPHSELILFFQLGSTVLLILFCTVFSFTTARLGHEVFQETENIALDRKRRDQETQIRLYKMQADTDRLTGLFSRRHGQEFIEELCLQQTPFIVAFIDVNGLKQFNDLHGHAAGDRYLTTFATKLSDAVGTATAVRWGGDEFVVVAPNTTKEELSVCFATIEGEVPVRGGVVPLRFSYGMAASDESSEADKLLNLADTRMYENKRQKSLLNQPFFLSKEVPAS